MPQPPPRRLALTAVLVILLPVLLLAGLWLGGHPEHLPSFLKKAFVVNHSTLAVDEAIGKVGRDYYRPIPTSSLSNASITGLVKSLGDRFSHYLTPSEFREFDAPPHFAGIGVSVNPMPRGLSVARVFDSSPAARAGLMPGDLIVGVGGRSLAGVSSEAATALIRGQPGTEVKLQVESTTGGHHHTRTVQITRELVSEPVVASVSRTIHGVKVGVVALAEFSPGAHAEVREAVEHLLGEKVKGIVFDLRGNGGGLVTEAQLIASIFLAKGATVVTTRGRTQPTVTLVAVGDAIPASIPVVVLVDSGTASASEIVTAALQDHKRATVAGTHTFGKGVFQEEEPLSNGGVLDITVGEYFTPDGRNLGGGGVKQGAGITPEVKISPSVIDTPRGLEIALETLAAKVK